MRIIRCLPFVLAALPLQLSASSPSTVSEVSAIGVSAVGEAADELIASGGALVLTAASVSAETGSLVISAAGNGASFVVEVSAGAATEASALIGSSIEQVAVSGGYLLMLAGEAICFVPDQIARHHLHRRELSR